MTWRNQPGKLLDFYCSGKENGNWHRTRNKKRSRKETTTENDKLRHVSLEIFVHESQAETRQKNKRSSHVTRRDAIPFKGHGGKTNNESRAVSPPLQKEKKKGVQEALWDFFFFFLLFFLWTKVLAGKRQNYISYSWSGTRPQAKKGNVLLNVTYWRDRAEVGKEKREGKKGLNNGIKANIKNVNVLSLDVV